MQHTSFSDTGLSKSIIGQWQRTLKLIIVHSKANTRSKNRLCQPIGLYQTSARNANRISLEEQQSMQEGAQTLVSSKVNTRG